MKLFRILGRMLQNSRRIHFDYASATPVRREVLDVMEPYWCDVWANPNSIYQEGVLARSAVDDARTRLARSLSVRASGVLFTSGGTESNNLAIVGHIEALHVGGRAYDSMEIVSTAIEHPSVLETLHALTERGVTVREVAVDGDGRVQRDAFTQSLSEKTVLATVAYVNSEVGTVQDIRELSRVIRAFEKEHGTRVIFHTDASQAPLWLPVNLETLGVDLLTLDAGKCYGPKGVGILAKRHSTKLSAIHHGGGQESGLRSGTENVPLIIGCAEAFMRAQEKWRSRSAATAVLRDQLFFELERVLPNVIVNGSREHRVANNVNISLPGLDSEYAVIWLDAHGIAASTKSACGSQDASGSTVVRAMTGDEVRARSTLRLTLGEETTKDDIKQLVRTLAAHVAFMNKSLPPASNSQERHN